jgi:hypothetical protein
MDAVCTTIYESADTYLDNTEIGQWYREEGRAINPESRLTSLLKHFAKISTKPLVLFIDEADALVGDTLISLLRLSITPDTGRLCSASRIFPPKYRIMWSS